MSVSLPTNHNTEENIENINTTDNNEMELNDTWSNADNEDEDISNDEMEVKSFSYTFYFIYMLVFFIN